MAAQETTTPQPKERIIFDADSYYGTEGENMAVEDIMERYGITEEEVREQYSDEEIFDREPQRGSQERKGIIHAARTEPRQHRPGPRDRTLKKEDRHER